MIICFCARSTALSMNSVWGSIKYSCERLCVVLAPVRFVLVEIEVSRATRACHYE